jgi:7-carboxy-7-deazaguanine synthase
MAGKSREIPLSYNFFASLTNAYFKYVVEKPEDIKEVISLNSRYGVPSGRTLLMPQAVSEAELREHSEWIVDQCLRNGFRFSTRLHVLLWGANRGV